MEPITADNLQEVMDLLDATYQAWVTTHETISAGVFVAGTAEFLVTLLIAAATPVNRYAAFLDVMEAVQKRWSQQMSCIVPDPRSH